jgi:hypothetical protein
MVLVVLMTLAFLFTTAWLLDRFVFRGEDVDGRPASLIRKGTRRGIGIDREPEFNKPEDEGSLL